MKIIPCTHEHLHDLQHISQITFKDTFADHNNEQDMLDYIETAFNLEKLGRELQEAASAFYIAYKNTEMVGYVKVNEAPAQTEINDATSLELERIYLRKDTRGRGEGQQLMDFVVNTAKDKQKEYLWLGVWENNQPALKFYQKHGFYAFSEHDFWVGNDRQRDILMRLDL